MEIQATAKSVRMSPKKNRPLANILRSLPAKAAVERLRYHQSKSAVLLSKVIRSAIQNAVNNYNLKEDNLKIEHLTVDAGSVYKRYWFRSHGGSDKLLKRTAHLKVVLTEIKPSRVKKPVVQPPTAKPAQPTEVASTAEPTPKASPAGFNQLPDKGRSAAGRRGLGKIFTPRTTNK